MIMLKKTIQIIMFDNCLYSFLWQSCVNQPSAAVTNAWGKWCREHFYLSSGFRPKSAGTSCLGLPWHGASRQVLQSHHSQRGSQEVKRDRKSRSQTPLPKAYLGDTPSFLLYGSTASQQHLRPETKSSGPLEDTSDPHLALTMELSGAFKHLQCMLWCMTLNEDSPQILYNFNDVIFPMALIKQLSLLPH